MMAGISIFLAFLLLAIRFIMFRRSSRKFHDEIFDMYVEQLSLQEDGRRPKKKHHIYAD